MECKGLVAYKWSMHERLCSLYRLRCNAFSVTVWYDWTIKPPFAWPHLDSSLKAVGCDSACVFLIKHDFKKCGRYIYPWAWWVLVVQMCFGFQLAGLLLCAIEESLVKPCKPPNPRLDALKQVKPATVCIICEIFPISVYYINSSFTLFRSTNTCRKKKLSNCKLYIHTHVSLFLSNLLWKLFQHHISFPYSKWKYKCFVHLMNLQILVKAIKDSLVSSKATNLVLS